jgi:YYY domain-containing protein
MLFFLTWYLLITILGWITFPLTFHLFPALADRGYTLSRAFGLLVWGFVFWLFANLGLAQNDIGGLLLGLIVLIGLGLWATFNRNSSTLAPGASAGVENRKSQIVNWLSENLRLILTTEILFLVAFAFMAFIRASNPETNTAGGEKWMEVAFINAVLHSPTFPPHDPWLSGYAISYYHFGYIMTGMLAMFTSTPASIAHNLMLPLIFAMSAIGAYGIIYNLLAVSQTSNVEGQTSAIENRKSKIGNALFGPLFLLLISNLEGFLHSLHHKGFFWQFNADGTVTSAFWTWLDIPDLKNVPPQILTWAPKEFFWWWRASRVISDYEFNGTWHEVIDEFPFFSYLLGDLHPHVLAMPFMLLAVAVALNIYLGGWRGRINLFFGELKLSWEGFFVSALLLGGLAFLNTWDILPGAALIVFSYVLARVRESGWGWERIEDVLLLGIPVMVTAYVMYLPFFIGFDSQAGGIVPSLMFPTRGAQLWVMWGTLFIPLFAYLIYLWKNKMPANWRAGSYTSIGLVFFLFIAMLVVSLLALALKPDLINPILAAQGMDAGTFLAESMSIRLQHIAGLLTLLALLIPTLSFLFSNRQSNDIVETDTDQAENNSSLHPSAFILLLIALGTLLILGPDFFYLRDNFGYRINTIFKFYYQAWELLSLATGFGVAWMFSKLRGASFGVYTTVMLIVIAAGLAYPVFALPNKTDNFKIKNPEQRTLDGAAYLATYMPDDYAAFGFMQAQEQGVIAEAVGGQYTEYARFATFTGMPTVLGWAGHEGQWRDYALLGSREQDISELYSSPVWVTTQDIIKRYNIRYIVVGNLERSTYHVNEEKFNNFLKPIFQQGFTTIYEVP